LRSALTGQQTGCKAGVPNMLLGLSALLSCMDRLQLRAT
jgi:hypothetical protein